MLAKYMIFNFFVLILLLVATKLAKANDNVGVRPARSTNQNVTECFFCDTPSSCRTPTTVTCDEKSANDTRTTLMQYFSIVTNSTNTEFDCLKMSYKLGNDDVLAISGCLNVDLTPCKLEPINITYSSFVCGKCNKNLCNAAGSFYFGSSIIMPAILASLLLLLKVFN